VKELFDFTPDVNTHEGNDAYYIDVEWRWCTWDCYSKTQST